MAKTTNMSFRNEIFELLYDSIECDYIIVDKSDHRIIVSESLDQSEGIIKNNSLEIIVRPIKLKITEVKEDE